MANQYKNKVVYCGETLIDLTEDTVTAETLLQGYTAHGADGAPIVGTLTQSSGAIVVTDETDSHGGIIKTITAIDLSNDTVAADKLLQGYTAHDRQGNAVTGTYSPPSFVTYRTGNSAPSDSLGSDGDIYLQAN